MMFKILTGIQAEKNPGMYYALSGSKSLLLKS